MTSYDSTIEDVLMSIKSKEVRTMQDITKLRETAIDEIMDDFLCYPKNQENIKKLKKDLQDYEVIDISNLYRDDYIAYLNTYHFYNISLEMGKVIRILDDGQLRIRVISNGNKSVYKTKQLDYIFRKLSDEDKVKINLVEAIYSMK